MSVGEMDDELYFQRTKDKIRKSSKKQRSQKLLKKQNTNWNSIYMLLNFLLVSLIAFIGYNYLFSLSTIKSISVVELANELHSKLLGQDLVINSVLESFQLLKIPFAKTIVTCLIGSTGVGKTHTINIIMKHVPKRFIHIVESKDLLLLIEKQNANFEVIANQIRSPSESVIILDDVRITDLDNLIFFLERIKKVDDANVLCILAFNIQSSDDKLNFFINYNDSIIIKKQLTNLVDNFYLANFTEIDRLSVETFLRKDLMMKNVQRNLHNYIIKTTLENHNLKYHGFKGLIKKMELELLIHGYKIDGIDED